MTIARITIACAHVLLIAGTAAYAADEAQPNVLQEVVVTAQKRAEGEQSVPLSMTTFGSAALQEKSINTFFDYATKVPNLAFAPTGDGVGTARTVSIRGISGDGVDQDDMTAFLGIYNAGKQIKTGIGEAPFNIRASVLNAHGAGPHYVNCPYAPYVGSNSQNLCIGK